MAAGVEAAAGRCQMCCQLCPWQSLERVLPDLRPPRASPTSQAASRTWLRQLLGFHFSSWRR